MSLLRLLLTTSKYFFTFIFLVSLTQFLGFFYFTLSSPTLHQSDLIVVFPGQPSLHRIRHSFPLVDRDMAPNLAIINLSAQKLKKIAQKNDLPASIQYLGSGKSRSTFEDVLETSKIIEDIQAKSVTLVTSSYHMPRAYYLLKTHLYLTGTPIKTQYSAVKWYANYDSLTLIKLYYNEVIKFWGSTIELLIYILSDKLANDSSHFQNIDRFAQKYILLSV